MKRPITDADIDRLLTARVRGTGPELDRRLAGLAAEVAQTGPQVRAWWRARAVWAWAAGPLAVAASVALWLSVGRGPVVEPDFELLFSLEESLSPAVALLEPENRSVLLAPEILAENLSPSNP